MPGVQDSVWLVVSVVVVFVPILKVRDHLGPGVLLVGWVTGPVASLALLALILARPSSYHKHREDLLTALKLLRIATAARLLWSYQNLISPAPPEPGYWLLTSLASKCSLLVVSALGFQLPLERTLLVQAVALASSLVLVPRRCAYECEEAGATAFYNRLVARLSMAAAKALPLGVASRHDARFRQPTPVAPCILLHSWAQATVGFLLPTLILRWSSSCRPRRVTRRYGGRPCTLLLRPQPAVLLAHYLALFLAAAAVGWSGLELALRAWQQVWGGALSSQRPPGTLPGA